MADLTNVLGGPWQPSPEKIVAPPEEQLRQAMIGAGISPPDQIFLDGQLHRFRSGTKGEGGHGDKTGWYVVFQDGIPAGTFGCWRAGLTSNFKADIGRKIELAEEMAIARRISEAKAIRDEQMKRQREVAAETVETIWSACMAASSSHPYLKRKGIAVNGARVTGDGRLVVPLFNAEGELSTLQYIDAEGGKLYHKGGQTGGCFWMLGSLDEPGVLYIAEGFATAATIREQTNRPCAVAYSASNIVPVTGQLREMYGLSQQIVIVADNDKSGVGQKYADQASAKYGAKVVMPPIQGDANDYHQAGHNLIELLTPPQSDWLVKADDFCAQPAPISWLIKHWLQDQALIMVHGPSGGGKTFAVLDWCLRIASGVEEWAGNRVRGGGVVYLAGEGHHGLRSRVAGWKQANKASSSQMWVSKHGCDLNTPEGYFKVVEHVQQLEEKPKMLVVDTLHRFLLGDENSAQDAKTMLDACNRLMAEFSCSVILVHHTGVSDEAQHRARGSSAWRGALDIEISVIPAKADTPMQIVQRKSKDSELAKPIYCELKQVEIKGWLDEDGEPVTTAIVEVVDWVEPEKSKKESKLQGFVKILERAWWSSGCEIRENLPYISRSGLRELLSKDGLKDRTIVNKLDSSRDDLIGYLLNAESITPIEHGWIISDESQASAILMTKK